MVKILEIEEQVGAAHEDDCLEIDAAEFAKKVNLKESDDVILVAAKGKIKVEVDKPEYFGKTSDGDGSDTRRECICISGDADDNQYAFAAGNSKENPCQIDEDESSVLGNEIVEDIFVIDRPSAGSEEADDQNDGQTFQGDEEERRCDTGDAMTGMLVVKNEPVDSNGDQLIPQKAVAVVDNGVKGAEDDAALARKMTPERRIFDEEDDEDVVVV